MKLYQSKFDNRSTSGSEYFKQRHSAIESIPVITQTQINIYPPNQLSQIGSLGSIQHEYNIFKPSDKLNQMSSKFQSHFSNSIKINSDKKFNQIPYSSYGYNQPIHKQKYFDNVYEKKGTLNEYKSLEKKLKSNKKTIKKLQFQTVSQAQSLNSSRQSHEKQNMFQQFKNKNTFNTKIANNPINKNYYGITKQQSPRSLSKQHFNSNKINYSSKKNILQNRKQNYQLYTSPTKNYQYDPYTLNKNYSEKKLPKTPTSSQDLKILGIQTHQVLQHIYCTIAYEQKIQQIFKTFINEQKAKQSNRFDHILQQLANKLNQVKLIFQKQLDQNYQDLLYQLRKVKDLAQNIWKGKQNTNIRRVINNNDINFGVDQNINKIPSNSNSTPNHHMPTTHNLLNSRQQQYINNNNINLIKQLNEQDYYLSKYKNTQHFYFHTQNQRNNNYTKQQQLKQMFNFSLKICLSIYQNCYQQFIQCLLSQNIDYQKHKKLKNWFKISQNSYKNQQQRQNNMKNQLISIEKFVNNFKNQIQKQFISLDNKNYQNYGNNNFNYI